MCKGISLKWNLLFAMCFFIFNVSIFIIFDYIENKPKPILFTIKFCLVFTFMCTIVIYITPEPKNPVIINENPIIIVKPPQWTYTYNSLDEYLPDDLIREIMKFQFTEDPKYFDFKIYKKL